MGRGRANAATYRVIHDIDFPFFFLLFFFFLVEVGGRFCREEMRYIDELFGKCNNECAVCSCTV